MEKKVKVFIVDDDLLVVNILERVITKVYPQCELHYHYDGMSALNALATVDEPCIVITDLMMPKLSGEQLLKRLRASETSKLFYIIVITAVTDAETNLRMLKFGADDFFTKPFSVDKLVVRMRLGLRYLKMLDEEKILKEKNDLLVQEIDKIFEEQIENLKVFQNLRMPELTSNISRIINSSTWIANQLGLTDVEIKSITKAAEVCFLGKLFLHNSIINEPVMVKGMVRNKLMEKVPENSRRALSKIKNSENIEMILYHIYENIDGSGFPEKRKSWEIPIGSRILRVAMDFEELVMKKADTSGKAIEYLLKESKRLYDHRVVALYDQYIAVSKDSQKVASRRKEIPIKLIHLEPNMEISRFVLTDSGLLLAAPNLVLNDEKIERILTITKTDPIVGRIFIKNN